MSEQTTSRSKSRDAAFAAELQRHLYHLVRVLELSDRACVSSLDVTVAQSYALLALPESGSMSMNELSAAMNLAGSTMTRVVDQLVFRGLAERAPDDEDRRVVRVTLSEEGRRTREAARQCFGAAFGRVAERVPEEQRQVFLNALREVQQALVCCDDECSA